MLILLLMKAKNICQQLSVRLADKKEILELQPHLWAEKATN